MISKTIRIFILFLLIVLLIPITSYSIRIEDEETETDILLMGLGILRVNYSSIEGNYIDFEKSDRGLPSYFSNNTQLDILAEGTFYHGYELEGYLHYRDITYNYEPNLGFYLKIKKELNYLSVGDHIDGVFMDTLFTRFEPEFRGGTLHIEDERYGFEIVSGMVRGEQGEDEIVADGTSGPYYISQFPIIEGSEEVFIRIRDKNNQSRIVRDESKRRGIDYNIDYDTGEIKFVRPVESTDVSGNPVFILVKYQYDDSEGGFNRFIAGSRFWFKPHEYVKVGFTYLTTSPTSDTIGNVWGKRLQIYGTDLTIEIEDTFFLGAEFAVSDNPQDEEFRSFARRLNFLWKPNEKLKIWGGYYLVEKDFLTFGNPTIELNDIIDDITLTNPFTFKSGTSDYDLNPENRIGTGRDEESWALAFEYSFTEDHTITTGYRRIMDNVPFDAKLPRTTSDDIFLTYTYTPADRFNYFVGIEYLRNQDDLNIKTTNDETKRLIIGTKGSIGETKITGPVKMEAAYIYDDYTDFVDRGNSEKSHNVLVRFDAEPTENLSVFIEQDEAFITGEEYGGLILREDTTYIGLLYDTPKFSLDTIYRFSREEDYVLGRVVEIGHLISTVLTYKPFETLTTRLKFEFGIINDRSNIPMTKSYSYLIEGEIIWDITPDLIMIVLYEMENSIDITSPARNQTYLDEATLILEYSTEEDILALYFEYKHERDRVRTYPLEIIISDTDTIIFGGRYRFTTDWELVWGFKYSLSYVAVDTSKMDSYIEVGYEVVSSFLCKFHIFHFLKEREVLTHFSYRVCSPM